MEKNNEIIITENEMQTSKLSIHEEKHMKSSKKKLIVILLSIIIAVMAGLLYDPARLRHILHTSPTINEPVQERNDSDFLRPGTFQPQKIFIPFTHYLKYSTPDSKIGSS